MGNYFYFKTNARFIFLQQHQRQIQRGCQYWRLGPQIQPTRPLLPGCCHSMGWWTPQIPGPRISWNPRSRLRQTRCPLVRSRLLNGCQHSMGRWTPQIRGPLLTRCCYSMGRWTPQMGRPLLPRCCYSMGRWTSQIPGSRLIRCQHPMGRWTHQMVKPLWCYQFLKFVPVLTNYLTLKNKMLTLTQKKKKKKKKNLNLKKKKKKKKKKK